MAASARELFGVDHPIVLAPMVGPSTPELCAAVSAEGGLGSLGGGNLTSHEIRDQVAAVRRATDRPFAVGLFIPDPPPDRSREAEMQAFLAPLRAELGIAQGPLPDPLIPSFDEQLQALIDARVTIASFTFGNPGAAVVARLHSAGMRVIGTATHVAEARALEDAGVDAIVAQGGEAGGHRGTFIGEPEKVLIGTLALVPQVVDAVRVPVLAAGGIMDGRGIAAALALGAAAAQLGTAFLTCDEAGTDPASRRHLAEAEDISTTLTRAFTGRTARGLRNRFIDDFADRTPAPYPLQHVLTSDVRAAARKQGRAELVNLWAGQAAPLGRTGPAAALVRALVEETRAALRAAAER